MQKSCFLCATRAVKLRHTMTQSIIKNGKGIVKMKEEFVKFLDTEREKCFEREKALIEDGRKDEANLCKVEANIYDIFRTLYRFSDKQGSSEEERTQLFLSKAKVIPANWEKSYHLAKEHNDSRKILVEETKLHTVEKIMREYHKIMEE